MLHTRKIITGLLLLCSAAAHAHDHSAAHAAMLAHGHGQPAAHSPAHTPPFQVLEGALPLPAAKSPDSAALTMPVKAAQKLLDSPDGASWTAYGAVGPACGSAPKREGKTKAARAAYAQKAKAHSAHCKSTKKACAEASGFAQTHDVPFTCSTLYKEPRALLTTEAPWGLEKQEKAEELPGAAKQSAD